MVMNRIILSSQIIFSGSHNLTPQELEKYNEIAHIDFFVANTIKAAVMIEK